MSSAPLKPGDRARIQAGTTWALLTIVAIVILTNLTPAAGV